jgi:hypothetical protein
VASVPYELICAVQDLYELYSRFGPRGPYRMQLFHDQAPAHASWPAAVRQRSARLDTLIRGASCLLANDLAPAALPVAGELWQEVCALERELGLAQTPQPGYYTYLSQDLAHAPREAQAAYRLFGEVLAVYLDVLSLAHRETAEAVGTRIPTLRQRIIYAGDSSSGLTVPGLGGDGGAGTAGV